MTEPRRLQVRLVLLLVTAPLVAYLLFSAARKGVEVYRLNQQQEQLQAQIANLKDRNVALRQELEYLKSDAYVEYAARMELGLAKPGDHVVVPVPAPGAGALPAPAATEAPAPVAPPWQRWWERFFGDAP